MRVYLRPPQPSRGLERIAGALRRYLPNGWSEVATQAEASLVVLYAIGRVEQLTDRAIALFKEKRKFAVIQVCLRSTQKPDTLDWAPLWLMAECVWSYYDLVAAIDADGHNSHHFERSGIFYHAPLGADPAIFYPRQVPRDTLICTTGLSRLSESVRECVIAAAKVGGEVFHLGAQLDLGDHVTCGVDLMDEQVAEEYSACQWVSALRRKEGFELPGIEGLLCGARPITFDTPDYRWCYGDHAEYVREGTRQEVIEQLVELFKRGPRPVTQEEIERARERYDWAKIVGGFYERITSD